MFKWIRIPKGIALAAFLLPWLTVSCSSQPIIKATGVGLAFGTFDTLGIDPAQLKNQQSANILLIFAMITIAVGLFFAIRKPAKAAVLTLCTSAASLIFIGLSMLRYSKSYLGSALDPEAQHPMAKTAASLIRVEYEYGFWLTILSLVAALILSIAAWREDKPAATETQGLPPQA
jgi:hypothetical protein